jgi:membrane protein insertase Oxa1/YidC/SpoIIIJ
MLEIYFETIYSVTSDWPMTIILGTLSARTLLITPLQLAIKSRLRRYESIQPILQSVTASHSLSLAKKSNLRKDLYLNYNCSPLKTIGIAGAQLPLFVGMSYSIQQILSNTTNTEFLWLQNLAVSDPSFILPIMLSATHLVNVSAFNPLSSRASKRLGYFISLAMIPISAYIPSGILLYWITSAFHAFATNVFSHLKQLCSMN